MDQKPDLKLLGHIFKRYPDVQAVYVFGSSASGHTHADSDLDLAIVPRHPKIHSRKLDMLTDLARAGFCDVDLVFLDTDDIVLKYEAVHQNKLVYHSEDFDRGAFYSQVVRQYLDFLPYLEVQRKAYQRRILVGQTRGEQWGSTRRAQLPRWSPQGDQT
jgi:predicted nucleotidyltransferase